MLQHTVNSLEVFIFAAEGYSKEIETRLIGDIRDRLVKKIDIKVTLVTSIPLG